jgi:hypothetical protein
MVPTVEPGTGASASGKFGRMLGIVRASSVETVSADELVATADEDGDPVEGALGAPPSRGAVESGVGSPHAAIKRLTTPMHDALDEGGSKP